MLVLTLERHDQTGVPKRIGQIAIIDEGTNPNFKRGNFHGSLYKQKSSVFKNPGAGIVEEAKVENFCKVSKSPWHLVALMLSAMGYGTKNKTENESYDG